jgi:hypothetical protein
MKYTRMKWHVCDEPTRAQKIYLICVRTTMRYEYHYDPHTDTFWCRSRGEAGRWWHSLTRMVANME